MLAGMEFPQINYQHYNGKKYRYAYGVGWHNKGKYFHTVGFSIASDTLAY